MNKKVIFPLLVLSLLLIACKGITTVQDEDQVSIKEELVSEEDVFEKELEDALKEIESISNDSGSPKAEVPPDVITIIAEETETINLVPDVVDADGDALEITYTSPFDDSGQWQTTYGDAGEYIVTITVSDSEQTTTMDALVIVNKKEEGPEFTNFEPKETGIEVKEGGSVEFKAEALDKNNDPIRYTWYLDGEKVSNDLSYEYQPDYTAAGEHKMKIEASDGVSEVTNEWNLKVLNVNKAPIISNISDIIVSETGTVELKVLATDPDGDDVKITISDPVGDDGTWETTYEDSGEYDVTITADDGTDKSTATVHITVNNVNRPPKILGISKK